MSSPKHTSKKAPDTSSDTPTDDKINEKVSSTKDDEEKENEHSTSPNAENTSDDDEQDAFNPNLPDGEEYEVLERLRGDAIGTTLYSERFVITTLMKLREIKKPLEEDEKLEADFESLWDMTIEKDVVLKLIELDVYAIFTQSIVNYEKDYRLIEIIVGITANMCSVTKEALQNLCKSEETVNVLLGLIACSDSCVLIQLMRLLTLAYGGVTECAQMFNEQILKFPEFFEHYCFILNSSNNHSLLEFALASLNAILAKCANSIDSATEVSESHVALLKKFINTNLVASTIEAFQTFYKKELSENAPNETDDFNNTHSASEALKNTFIVFLNVHEIFFNYKPEVYNEDNEIDLCGCFNIVLQTVATKNFILFSNNNYLRDLLETLSPLYTLSKNRHNEETVLNAIHLWRILRSHADVTNTNGNKTNDFECDDPTANDELIELCELSEELLHFLLKQYKGDVLAKILGRCKTELALKIFKLYGVKIDDYHEEEFDAYCKQLNTLLNA